MYKILGSLKRVKGNKISESAAMIIVLSYGHMEGLDNHGEILGPCFNK